jgi:MFS family permease
MIGIGALLLGTGMLLLSLSCMFSLAMLACIIYTIGEMIFFSLSHLICYQNGAEKKKGSSLGIYRMIYASSRVVGPTLGGLIYQQWSGDALWYICGFIGLACFSACYHYRKYA